MVFLRNETIFIEPSTLISKRQWRELLCCTYFTSKQADLLKFHLYYIKNVTEAVTCNQTLTPNPCDVLHISSSHILELRWPSPLPSSCMAGFYSIKSPTFRLLEFEVSHVKAPNSCQTREETCIYSVNWEKAEYCLVRIWALPSFKFAKNSVMSHIIYFILFPKLCTFFETWAWFPQSSRKGNHHVSFSFISICLKATSTRLVLFFFFFFLFFQIPRCLYLAPAICASECLSCVKLRLQLGPSRTEEFGSIIFEQGQATIFSRGEKLGCMPHTHQILSPL